MLSNLFSAYLPIILRSVARVNKAHLKNHKDKQSYTCAGHEGIRRSEGMAPLIHNVKQSVYVLKKAHFIQNAN